ncbi:unnamed protein product [Trichogramma brassicae]|uniref:Uncharacterized protein n=1 Tax=Trichogramma brassicae TaxID=86971 RepID=A0A6H5J3X0_9HYME|nr:unnamed protein product [Trichogramma brassicae]
MKVSIKNKRQQNALRKIRKEKRKQFVKIFIKRREWQEEDLVAFIVDEFNESEIYRSEEHQTHGCIQRINKHFPECSTYARRGLPSNCRRSCYTRTAAI